MNYEEGKKQLIEWLDDLVLHIPTSFISKGISLDDKECVYIFHNKLNDSKVEIPVNTTYKMYEFKEYKQSLTNKSCGANLYTNDYIYHISVTIGESVSSKNGYLICTSSCRKKKPGEEHIRGNDISDGSFCSETWIRILNGIIRNELCKINIAPQQPILNDVK